MKKMNITARGLGAFLLAFCLAALLLPGRALAAGEYNFARFENATPGIEGLTVSKTVSNSADVSAEHKEDEFTFYIELDGDPAREQEYLYFNSSGKQLYRFYDPENANADDTGCYVTATYAKGKTEVAFETDLAGFFTLKAGERAVFPDLAGGTAYSVLEYPAEGFAAVSPAAETPLTGTLDENGIGTAAFTNRYVVAPPPGGGGGGGGEETGLLYVRKLVAWPAELTYKADTAFSMVLAVNGEPWASKAYSVLDENNSPVSSGTTGADGSFAISKGEVAIFEDIPLDTEFTVSEAMPSGWWAQGVDLEKNGVLTSGSGSSVTEATALSGRTTVTFTNAAASFVVTKALAEGAVDTGKAFTFNLMHGDGSAWPYADYWLYNANGEPDESQYNAGANNGAGAWEPLNTDAGGRFTLLPGQRALFVGIAPGTDYRVSETPTEHYMQTQPENAAGYAKKVQSAVETLPFVNGKVTDEYGVSVSKTVVNNTAAAIPEVSFRFKISRITEEGEEAQPWANAVYEIRTGSGAESYTTDENGEFSLTDGQTAGFRYAVEGTTYVVKELGTEPEILNERFTVEGEDTRWDTYIIDNGPLTFAFVNDFNNADVEWGFYKVDAQNSAKTLPGAKFRLIRGLYADGAYTWPETWDGAIALESDENGYVDLGSLTAGVYKMEETQSPASYFLPSGYWIVTVDLLQEEPVSVEAVNNAPAFKTVAVGESEAAAVANTGSFAMPYTGGNVLLLYALAAVLFTASVLVFFTGRGKSAAKRQSGGGDR